MLFLSNAWSLGLAKYPTLLGQKQRLQVTGSFPVGTNPLLRRCSARLSNRASLADVMHVWMELLSREVHGIAG